MRSTAKLAVILASAAALGFAVSSLAQPDERAAGKRYVVQLTGEEEVTNTGTPNQGDLDGTGTAVIVVNPGQRRVCWDINFSGVALPVLAAHIHIGFRGQAFPNNIVVNLSPSSGCTTTPVSAEVIDALMQAPQAFYVNIHNGAFPPGALRGQVGSVPRS